MRTATLEVILAIRVDEEGVEQKREAENRLRCPCCRRRHNVLCQKHGAVFYFHKSHDHHRH